MLSIIVNIILAIVDIGILAFLIYELVVVLRSTRAMRLVKGVALLAIISIVANAINLHGTAWILGRIWTWGVIAFIILFQSEIKQGINRLGQRWTFFGGSSDLRRSALEVTKAAERMINAELGGLIVFEKDDPLDYYVDSGIKMDAIVSWQTIVSIFSPESPMRDGAIIIRGSRIASSGIILPISRELLEKNTEFGYRHKAAIGLGIATDALAIVISQDEGTIAVACGGKLHTNVKSINLDKMIISYLLSRPSKEEEQ